MHPVPHCESLYRTGGKRTTSSGSSSSVPRESLHLYRLPFASSYGNPAKILSVSVCHASPSSKDCTDRLTSSWRCCSNLHLRKVHQPTFCPHKRATQTPLPRPKHALPTTISADMVYNLYAFAIAFFMHLHACYPKHNSLSSSLGFVTSSP